MKKINFALIPLAFFISACALEPAAPEVKPQVEVAPTKITEVKVDLQEHKSIFVFFDGTANDKESKTNVWRLYEMIENNKTPQALTFYIPGVGSLDDPLDTKYNGRAENLLEAALGAGMQQRILQGYEFLAKNYKPDDSIYIFGFSRGAHQARSLAGLIAYAGLPNLTKEDLIRLENDKDYVYKIGKDILKVTKKQTDRDYLGRWKEWHSGQQPLLADQIGNKKINGVKHREMQPAEITFLGVWDTVPGSSFKKYNYCEEHRGIFRRGGGWIPAVPKGERYKTNSYPPIHRIVHAVSLDEKRSKFTQLLACPAIENPNPTKVTEVWFPGAHADVGGGYEDSNELPGISLNWMIKLLADSYPAASSFTPVPENPLGLAHWSIGDAPANALSKCQDRVSPAGAKMDASIETRQRNGKNKMRKNGTEQSLDYPITCPMKVSHQVSLKSD